MGRSRVIRRLRDGWVFPALLMFSIFQEAGAQGWSDEEGCLMCHRYRRMAKAQEDGMIRNFHIDGLKYRDSIHGRINCSGCHGDITVVPHPDEVKPVDCGRGCHLQAPYSEEEFSHAWAVAEVEKSVHAVKPGDEEWMAKVKPDCKYCHPEPSYIPPPTLPEKAVERCMNCHREEGIKVALDHITHRLRKKTTRGPEEIVELCSKNCHEDKYLMARFGLDINSIEAVETYKETLHWRVVQFGLSRGADCMDCHATTSLHDIRRSDDPEASIHTGQRYRVCQQEGCHPQATKSIVSIDPHLSKNRERKPEIHAFEKILQVMTALVLFGLVSMMLLETYGRLRGRDARFFRWKRRPLHLSEEERRRLMEEVKRGGMEGDGMEEEG